MRKLSLFIAIACLLHLLCSVSAIAAEGSIDVTSEVATVDGRQQLSVTVTVPTGIEIAGASVRLAYDSSKLTVIEAQPGELPSALVNTENEGEVRSNFFGVEGISSGGMLFSVCFEYQDGAAADATDISVTYCSLSDMDGYSIVDVPVTATFDGETVELDMTTSAPSAGHETQLQESANASPEEEVSEDGLSLTDEATQTESTENEGPFAAENDFSQDEAVPWTNGWILLGAAFLVLVFAVVFIGLRMKRKPRGRH